MSPPPVPSPDPKGLVSCTTPAEPALPSPTSPAGPSLGDPPVPNATGGTPDRAGRYLIEEEIARGGMGVVLRARDPDLARPLAVKVLLPEHRGRADLERRFVEEAQLTGQLQHPGVPPVHELGRLPDGRPFFALKLVKGHTLTELLRQRRGPADDLPRLLQVFEQVCQTVAYAHARGILHRDLKPGNVMVGAFGEVQVMDWGLAKVLTAASVAGLSGGAVLTQQESTVYTSRAAEPSSATQAGTVLGTPAYMAPEQARGQVEFLDEHADVFGLGAILCEALTGKPPYTAATAEDLRRRAAQGALDEARERLGQCGADRELVELALACLEFEPGRRPRDAGVVAGSVAAYRTGVQERLRQAELSRAAAQVKAAEERKRRRLWLALAAAVLVVVVLGGSGWAWFSLQRAEAEGAAEAALKEATLLRDEQKWPESLHAASRARDLLAGRGVRDGLRQRVGEVWADLSLVTRLEQILLRETEVDVRQSRFDAGRALPDYTAAFADFGLGPETTSPEDAAARIQARPEPVRGALLAGLNRWLWLAEREKAPERGWLVQVVSTADPDPWRAQLRRAVAQQDRPALERLAREVNVAEQPSVLTMLAEALIRAESHTSAAELLRRAHRRGPSNFWVNHGLGMALESTGRRSDTVEAVRFYSAALALRPDNAGVYLNLGVALENSGNRDGAIAAYREAIRLQPKYGAAYNNLGNALRRQGKLAEAATALRKAVELSPESALCHGNLLYVLVAQGKAEESAAALREVSRFEPDSSRTHRCRGELLLVIRKDYPGAIAAFRTAVQRGPNDAAAHNGLGLALRKARRLDEAIPAFRAACRLKPEDAGVHRNLGIALAAARQYPEAATAFRQALRFEPADTDAHFLLGSVLEQTRAYEEAIHAYREAIRLQPRTAHFHHALGSALDEMGAWDEAAAACAKAIHLNKDYAPAYTTLGVIQCDRKRDFDSAIRSFTEAVRLRPGDAVNHYNLGTALRRKGLLDQAITAYQEAIRLNKESAQAYYNLGLALAGKGQVDQALAAYQKAIDLQLNDADAHDQAARLFFQKKDLGRAAEALRQVVRLKPGDPKSFSNLGLVLIQQGKLVQAAGAYERAADLKPDWAEAHMDFGVALARLGKGPEAIAAFRKATKLKPGLALAHFNLGVTLRDLGKLDEAVIAFRQAIKQGPNNAQAHFELGSILAQKRDGGSALAAYRAAIQFQPDHAPAHERLGQLLEGTGDRKGAIAAYKEVVRLRPRSAAAHRRLGMALQRIGAYPEAMTTCRKGIAVQPEVADGYRGLAYVLWKIGREDEAIDVLRRGLRQAPPSVDLQMALAFTLMSEGAHDQALEAALDAVLLQPSNAVALGTLGQVYFDRGEFGQALLTFRRATRLAGSPRSSATPAYRASLPYQVKTTEKFIALAPRLPALRRGELKPANAAEHVELAVLCDTRRLYLTAATQYQAAFAARPALADVGAGHRDKAARAAVQAGLGEGEDAATLVEAERAKWRKQALEWLQADLAVWARLIDKGKPPQRLLAQAPLRRWRRAAALAGVRGKEALAKLPEAERAGWQKLWSEVDELVKKGSDSDAPSGEEK
jgi:serine/threonine-protein kinase